MDSGLNEALRSAGGSALKAASTGAVLVLLGVCLLGRAAASERAALSFKVVSTRQLEPEHRWAQDVAWDGDSQLVVAAGRSGLVRFSVARDGSVQIVGTEAGCPVSFAAMVAVSDGTIVVVGPNHEIAWRRSGARGWTHYQSRELDLVLDVDVDGDRLAWLGAMRQAETHEYAPEGAVAWAADLRQGVSERSPVLFSGSGPGAPELSACGCLMVGAVRYLPDGSLLVAPGVEPGAFVIERHGGVREVLDLQTAGVETRCQVSEEERQLLARSVAARFELQLNRHDTLDDIVLVGDRPLAVVRRAGAGHVHWEAVGLGPGLEELRGVRLPLDPPGSSWVRVSCDGAGDTLAILETNYDEQSDDPPRLVLIEVTS